MARVLRAMLRRLLDFFSQASTIQVLPLLAYRLTYSFSFFKRYLVDRSQIAPRFGFDREVPHPASLFVVNSTFPPSTSPPVLSSTLSNVFFKGLRLFLLVCEVFFSAIALSIFHLPGSFASSMVSDLLIVMEPFFPLVF